MVAYRPVSSIFCHRNARAMAFTSMLSMLEVLPTLAHRLEPGLSSSGASDAFGEDGCSETDFAPRLTVIGFSNEAPIDQHFSARW